MSNKVITLNPKYQAGLDFYEKREFRGVYLGASDRAKRYYESSFYDLIATYQNLTDEDWNYIIGHVHWGMAKWGLAEARKKYGRK